MDVSILHLILNCSGHTLIGLLYDVVRTVWNSLPLQLRSPPSRGQFRAELKTHRFNEANTSL